ncbi:uncharacterized protein BO80DRAFT_142829 [Aspergillus ibericus CBS 121593]|uniref:Uncharacterized protein n=1 Tax=Aspergillus ibericus CBS 121593 TaxID=1448316 RepID=A0A395GWE4_9EURO|nr:hypothetical protein BO80DRAFT_142829 [Aspergillus ibericus CBS 121593]RAK99007.1 hypothetical protein BO80DRAFT_142829 [Aspergillus ibericus CBS 121593]
MKVHSGSGGRHSAVPQLPGADKSQQPPAAGFGCKQVQQPDQPLPTSALMPRISVQNPPRRGEPIEPEQAGEKNLRGKSGRGGVVGRRSEDEEPRKRQERQADRTESLGCKRVQCSLERLRREDSALVPHLRGGAITPPCPMIRTGRQGLKPAR